MQIRLGRTALERNAAAFVVVLVFVVALMAGLSRGSLITSSDATISTTLASQRTTSTETFHSAGLNVTSMFVIVLSGSFQPPSYNSTTIDNNRTSYSGSPGATFTVDVDIEYNDCNGSSCPSAVTSLSVAPASFTVRSIVVDPPNSGAGLPALVSVTSGSKKVCNFIVAITAPTTPYTGPLTLTALTG